MVFFGLRFKVINLKSLLIFSAAKTDSQKGGAPQFDWRDALNLESQLTDEEKMVRDQFKQYCDDKLMPRILMANRHEGISLF